MRRIVVLTLALAFVLGGISAAKADGIDVKVKGQWDFAFGWATNVGWSDSIHHERAGRNDDDFIARSRVRTQINFITSEYLQGVLMFEIGGLDWGRDNGSKVGGRSGGGIDADGVNVKTKRAFLDWIIPNTEVSVRMGIQGVSLPMANGYCNPVFSADVAGIVVNTPITEMFGVTAFWLRPFNRTLNDGANNYWNDEMDMFGLTLPITGDGWSVTPWGMYSRIGNASEFFDYYGMGDIYNADGRAELNSGANAWWAGISTQIDIWDPLTFGFDIMYGHQSKADIDIWNPDVARGNIFRTTEYGTRGWFVDAALNYKLDWGTPGIFGW